jgi:hypothetical protein
METDYYYRWSFSPILLSQDGRIPQTPTPLTFRSVADFDSQVFVLDNVWKQSSYLLSDCQNRLPSPLLITEPEVRRAWYRWLQSHHSFFLIFSLLAYGYTGLNNATAESDFSAATTWAEYVSALWRSAGGLMRYGCDFEPLKPIYEKHIRSTMPEGFSGFWIREWVAVKEASLAWQHLTATHPRKEVADMNAVIQTGRGIYNDHHHYVMHAAVTDGKSLARKYIEQQGCPHCMTEIELKIYDNWFRVTRVGDQTKPEFMNVACKTFSETLLELTSGHRLSGAIVKDIVQGIQVGIRIFGSWFPPTPETSGYCPQLI